MDTNTIIEGTVKFRDGKKWKSRWCVMRKLSPVADCLHLQLYRDSRDRYKHGLTKASLSLQHFLGLETGFTLDKESNTVAIVCQDLIVVLAFDTRERLIQWQVKIYNHLGEDQQFLIQISVSPPKAKLSPGPAKLHVQERKFCLTTGVPPKLAGCWEIKHLRRFGVIDGKFCFEGGSLCGRGEGLYIFLTDQGDEITHSVQLASEGKLNSLRRPLIRNMSVQYESPRKKLILRTETRLSEISCAESCMQTQTTVRPPNDIAQPWPSMETQADVYGHGDTSSLADFPIDSQNIKICNWNIENHLGRCVSCIGKLGLISRPSTAANTPGSINFNPWSVEDSKLCLTGVQHENFIDEMEYTCDSSCISMSQKSKYSNSSSSGTECSDQPSCQHSLLNNTPKNFQTSISPPKNFQSNNNSFTRYETNNPPCRPPKPSKYRNFSNSTSNTPVKNKINKLPMPLPSEIEENSFKTSSPFPYHLNDQYDNYDLPKIEDVSFSHQKSNDLDNYNQYYDTPRNIKVPLAENQPFPNYDIPPAAVPLTNNCVCSSKLKIIMKKEENKNVEMCFCHQLLRYSQPWMQLPFHLSCRSHWQSLTMPKSFEHCGTPSLKEIPVYAKVDLSKKTKNRVQVETDVKNKTENKEVETSSHYASNYMNIRFKDEDENYKRLTNLNYMNLEFTNSLRYYENVRELLYKMKNKERIDSLNIDLPIEINNLDSRKIQVCHKCGHTATETKRDDYDKPKSKKINCLKSEDNRFENYVPMSPLKFGNTNSSLTFEKSASNPILSDMRPMSGRHRKTSIGILGTKYSTMDSFTKYVIDRTDSRKRSNSAGSPKRDVSPHDNSKDNDSSNVDSRIPIDSDSGLESDKLSQENDDTLENLRHRKDTANVVAGSIRRLSNIVCKSSNRDSSSSNDSGFSSGSLKYPCQDFTDFEMPLTTAVSAKRHHSFNQHCHKNSDNYSPAPRRTKSSDPLRDLAFQFHRGSVPLKSSSAEAELPLYLNKRERCNDCTSPPETTVSVPYVDCRSTSSGTSDMSDYIETLSISSHSSSDIHSTDAVRLHQSVVTTLKPRSGNEYQKVDRISLLDSASKMKSDTSEIKCNISTNATVKN